MSEDEVIQKARRAELASRAERGIAGQGAIVEIVGELIEALETQQQSTNKLTDRIRRLNVWLLLVTVVIGALTLVQLLLGLKIIGR